MEKAKGNLDQTDRLRDEPVDENCERARLAEQLGSFV
jgi:hypothetical protein